VGVLESGMFKNIEETDIRKGDFLMLFTSGKRLKKYLSSILIALPNWFVIGILITFSDKFALKMNIRGAVDPGKAIMVAYAAISLGDIAIGFISQWMKSRKKALLLFHVITVLAVVWFFNLQGQTASTLYVVCLFLGLGTGFWAMFVTMAAEQFGTNIRATVATTAPNMARGSLNLVSLLFVTLQSYIEPSQAYFKSGWITGIVVFLIAFIALAMTEETFGKDLNYIER
jgi:MFS transporter, putative metabolite:H+ symporter